MKLLIFSVLFTFISTLTGVAASNTSLIGTKAPELSGKKAIGNGLIKLSRLFKEIGFEKDKKGKFIERNGKYVLKITKNVVVINFFSTSCIPCIREIPTYNDVAKHFRDKNVKLIYINIDYDISDARLIHFIKRRGIQVPMMLANQKEAIRKYSVSHLPRIVIIDKNQNIAHELKGFKEDLNKKLVTYINDIL